MKLARQDFPPAGSDWDLFLRVAEMRSRGGNTALHESVRSKSLKVAERIAGEGREMLSAAIDEGRSPLCLAVEMG